MRLTGSRIISNKVDRVYTRIISNDTCISDSVLPLFLNRLTSLADALRISESEILYGLEPAHRSVLKSIH